MSDKKLYPDDWVRIQWYIERNAGLTPINSSIYHRTSIDEKCLKRKKKLWAILTENVSKLEVYFTEQVRQEFLVLQGRRLHRQYKEMIDGLEEQIKYIDAWLSEETPF